MLTEKVVRDGYWVMAHLARFEEFVSGETLMHEMYKTRLFMISAICGPLVDAGLLLRKKEKNVTGYKLARLPEEILLVDIHKAFNKKWHQEFSSIELFLAECLGEKTLADLCRYEEVEMKDILLRKLVL
ncbi:MAG: hypothetical protein RL097_266 [Candidatus Parcubacteria bacterium]|jgi:DNA-binding IscR family transcriptional regulator